MTETSATYLRKTIKQQRREYKTRLRGKITALFYADASKLQQPQHYRLEWFQELHARNSSDHVGLVKFEVIIGYDPHATIKFSARLGFSIVEPAHYASARGFYQNFGLKECVWNNLPAVMVVPLNILEGIQTPIEVIEEAIQRTAAVGHQPYKASDYNLVHLQEKLGELYSNGVSCMASGAFPNPLHPDLEYRLVAEKRDADVSLHCVGVCLQGLETARIGDIRKYTGEIVQIVDSFHHSLSRSYISPEELTGAIRGFEPSNVRYL